MPPLRALVDADHEVVLVVTRPDRRRGRGGATSPSPVKAAALDLGLVVSHDHRDVIGAGADLGVVVAYGRIIPTDVLAALPMVNLHFSRLPRWRGAAPVERALLAGDTETAVDVMAVEEGLDTGPIYARREVPIGDRATLEGLRAELVATGTQLLVDTLAGPLPAPVPQSGDVVVASKIDPAERRLDWSRPAVELDRVVRVGGAWTTWHARRLKVTEAEPVPAGGATAAPGTLVARRRRGGRRRGRPTVDHRAARGQGADVVARLRQRCPDRARRQVRRRAAPVGCADARRRAAGQGVDGQRRGRRRHPRRCQRAGPRRAAHGRRLRGGRSPGHGRWPGQRRRRSDRPGRRLRRADRHDRRHRVRAARPDPRGHAPGHRARGARTRRGDAPDQPVRSPLAWRSRRARRGDHLQHARFAEGLRRAARRRARRAPARPAPAPRSSRPATDVRTATLRTLRG